MKAVPLLLMLAVASPAFAQAPVEKPSAPSQDQKPFIYDPVTATRCRLPSDRSPQSAKLIECGLPAAKPPVTGTGPDAKPAPKPDIG